MIILAIAEQVTPSCELRSATVTARYRALSATRRDLCAGSASEPSSGGGQGAGARTNTSENLIQVIVNGAGDPERAAELATHRIAEAVNRTVSGAHHDGA
jgi:hypothetical protein